MAQISRDRIDLARQTRGEHRYANGFVLFLGTLFAPAQDRGEAEIVAAQYIGDRIQPADVMALALFFASDDARICTGHEYFVDAGWR